VDQGFIFWGEVIFKFKKNSKGLNKNALPELFILDKKYIIIKYMKLHLLNPIMDGGSFLPLSN